MLYNCAVATFQSDQIHRVCNTRILNLHIHTVKPQVQHVVVTVDKTVKGMKVNNEGRDQGKRMDVIRKKVNESWSKVQNPNLFGGGPIVGRSWKIISVDISAFGFSNLRRSRQD